MASYIIYLIGLLGYCLIWIIDFVEHHFALCYLFFSYYVTYRMLRNWYLPHDNPFFHFLYRAESSTRYGRRLVRVFERDGKDTEPIRNLNQEPRWDSFISYRSYMYNQLSLFFWKFFALLSYFNTIVVIPYLFWLNAIVNGAPYSLLFALISIIGGFYWIIWLNYFFPVVNFHHLRYRYRLYRCFILAGGRILLFVCVLLGSFGMLLSGNLLTLFLSLEIQSLALYTIAALSQYQSLISNRSKMPSLTHFLIPFESLTKGVGPSSLFLRTGSINHSVKLISESGFRTLNLDDSSGNGQSNFQNDFQENLTGSSNRSTTSLIGLSSRFFESNFFFSSVTHVEAGLKYFVLGSVASSFLVFSISLFYGATGTIFFSDFSYFESSNLFVLLILVALLFKVGVAPFHWWVADVYHGVPLLTTLLFSILPKIPVWYLIFYLFSLGFSLDFYFDYLIFFSILSIFVGSFGALNQYSFKRLMAYSAISHSGYLLLVLSSDDSLGLPGLLLYMSFYAVSLLLVFIIVLELSVRRSFFIFDNLNNFRFYEEHNPITTLILVFSIFSISGIPPLIGFYLKVYPVYLLVTNHSYYAALIVSFLSAVSVVYYLRLIRVVLLRKEQHISVFFKPISSLMAFFISILFSFVIFGFLYNDDLSYILSFVLL